MRQIINYVIITIFRLIIVRKIYSKVNSNATSRLKPNSITLASLELAPNMFRASSELVRSWLRTCSELVRSWLRSS